MDRGASQLSEIRLRSDESVVSFEFSALDYTAPSKNLYRFKLEGFDPEWVDARGLRRATYTNLAPGSYTFRVIGSNNDGVWNEAGAVVAVSVPHRPGAAGGQLLAFE